MTPPKAKPAPKNYLPEIEKLRALHDTLTVAVDDNLYALRPTSETMETVLKDPMLSRYLSKNHRDTETVTFGLTAVEMTTDNTVADILNSVTGLLGWVDDNMDKFEVPSHVTLEDAGFDNAQAQ